MCAINKLYKHTLLQHVHATHTTHTQHLKLDLAASTGTPLLFRWSMLVRVHVFHLSVPFLMCVSV